MTYDVLGDVNGISDASGAFTLDISGYYKDVKNLIQQAAEEASA